MDTKSYAQYAQRASSPDKLIWILEVASALMDAAERNVRTVENTAYCRALRTAQFVRSQLLTVAVTHDKSVELEVALRDLNNRLCAYRAETDAGHSLRQVVARGTAA